jgi:hypothetical protein
MTVGQLRALVEGRTDAFEGVGTVEAAKIAGEPPRVMRRLWHQWDRQQAKSERPEVRVSRKTGSPRSDMLFHAPDLFQYRRARAGGPRLEPAPPDPNDPDAIADALFRSRRG